MSLKRISCSDNPFDCSMTMTEGMMVSEGVEGTASRSFCIDSVNKENFNLNKEEATKLSIEPQQMKRKKKGGGYNLRKSLAWDRAFFTEEGILLEEDIFTFQSYFIWGSFGFKHVFVPFGCKVFLILWSYL